MITRVSAAFFLFLTIWSFAPLQAITIEGRFLGNFIDSKFTYLYETFGHHLTKIDSAELLLGAFRFERDRLPVGYYKIGPEPEKAVTLILGNEDVVFEANVDDNPQIVSIQGSPENTVDRELQAYNQELRMQKATLNKQVKALYGKLSLEKYKIRVERLKQQFDSLDDVRNEHYLKIAMRHPGLFVGEVAAFLHYKSPSSRSTYFEPTDFENSSFLRGAMIEEKTVIYFQRMLPRRINYWISGATRLLTLPKPKSPAKELLYQSVIALYLTSAPDQVLKLAKDYEAEFPGSPYMKSFVAGLPKGPPEVGDLAPDILLEDEKGNIKKLSSLRGQLVLVDFWASWCKPCRIENPSLVKAYNKFVEKGFTVYGVSLDTNREKWLKAVKKDGLVWHQVSDLRGWKSEGARIYGVDAIPASFLIDKEGHVIARDLRGEKLTRKLERILN